MNVRRRMSVVLRDRWQPVVLLAGSFISVVALYLPWGQNSCGARCTAGDLFAASRVGGWATEPAQFVALSALVLAALAVAAIVRPYLAARLPLATCAGALAYFVLGNAIAVRSLAHEEAAGSGLGSFDYAYGSYLAAAAALLVVATAVWLRRSEAAELLRPKHVVRLAALLALLLGYLLPWERFAVSHGITLIGLAQPAALVGATLAFVLAHTWRRESDAGAVERLVLAAAVALFTVASIASIGFRGSHAYGAWLALGAALALVVLSLPVSGFRGVELARPPWSVIATAVGATLLVVGMFLPWQRACYGRSSDFGALAGRCVSTSGWTTVPGTAAALLALGLFVVALAPRRLPLSAVELASGVALLTTTLGFELQTGDSSGVRWHIGYGLLVGAAGALLLVAATLPARRPHLGWSSGAGVTLLPLAVVAAYLLVVVLPWWDVLPDRAQAALSFAPLSWLTIAGLLIAIHLGRLWLDRATAATTSPGSQWLVILPMVLLTLAGIDLARLRSDPISWGEGALTALALALALLGRIEHRKGFGRLRVPQVLRVDRL